MNNDDFAVFILSNGRADNVLTYKTLFKYGYTGKIFIIIDDLDEQKDKYIDNFGDQVIVFNKKAIAKTFDNGDNFNDMRAIVYARNACFDIAKKIGIKYFIQLDDDYVRFQHRIDINLNYKCIQVNKSLDKIFSSMLDFFITSGVSAFAMSQAGDFVGGEHSTVMFVKGLVGIHRKCMNSFICSVDRPFQFIGRVNEDVNTYTHKASQGMLFFSTSQVSLSQCATQQNKGGMTEMYLDSGTYIKSFYSVMYHPSAVKVSVFHGANPRLHHKVNWNNTTPFILNESLKIK